MKIKVTVTFIYDKVKGEKDIYYQNKAFDEIYNSDDTLRAEEFEVKETAEGEY